MISICLKLVVLFHILGLENRLQDLNWGRLQKIEQQWCPPTKIVSAILLFLIDEINLK